MDEEKTTDDQPNLVQQKVCAGQMKAVASDADTLAGINQYSLTPLASEDVFTGQMHLANTQYDRSDERFPREYLQRFADTLPGKSVMTVHDYRQIPVGRFYDAEVRPDPQTGGHYLAAKYYLAADGPVTKAVQMGIAKDVSIGFMPDTRVCDLDGKDYDGWYKAAGGNDADDEPCSHIKGRMYQGRKATVTYGGDLQKVEAQEGSFVWLGCQIGAQTMKDAQGRDEAKAKHFDTLAPAAGKGETMEKELAAALARVKELETENERLKGLAEDGKSYREWQKQEILRLHTALGEEQTGKALVTALDAASAASLEKVRAEVDTRHGKAFAQGAGQVVTADEARGAGLKRTAEEILFGVNVRRGRE